MALAASCLVCCWGARACGTIFEFRQIWNPARRGRGCVRRDRKPHHTRNQRRPQRRRSERRLPGKRGQRPFANPRAAVAPRLGRDVRFVGWAIALASASMEPALSTSICRAGRAAPRGPGNGERTNASGQRTTSPRVLSALNVIASGRRRAGYDWRHCDGMVAQSMTYRHSEHKMDLQAVMTRLRRRGQCGFDGHH
jgi:hypothetical protein